MVLSASFIALCLAAFVVPFFWKSASHNPVSMLFFFGCFWLGLRSFRRASRRQFGIKTEFKAVQKLSRWIPKDWTIQQGVFIGAGDLDILVKSPQGQTFAIEVKSQRAVAIKGWFMHKLVRTGGSPFPRDPLKQASANAQRVRGQPILWFPRAMDRKLTQLDGVIVVLGQKDYILRALGLRKTFLERLFSFLTTNKD